MLYTGLQSGKRFAILRYRVALKIMTIINETLIEYLYFIKIAVVLVIIFNKLFSLIYCVAR